MTGDNERLDKLIPVGFIYPFDENDLEKLPGKWKKLDIHIIDDVRDVYMRIE